MTATATAPGSASAIARAAGPATTSSYGSSSGATKLAHVVCAAHDVAGGDGALSFAKFLDRLAVCEDFERLLERVEGIPAFQGVIGGRGDEGGRAFVLLRGSLDAQQ
jgi:hypothetical protein